MLVECREASGVSVLLLKVLLDKLGSVGTLVVIHLGLASIAVHLVLDDVTFDHFVEQFPGFVAKILIVVVAVSFEGRLEQLAEQELQNNGHFLLQQHLRLLYDYLELLAFYAIQIDAQSGFIQALVVV